MIIKQDHELINKDYPEDSLLRYIGILSLNEEKQFFSGQHKFIADSKITKVEKMNPDGAKVLDDDGNPIMVDDTIYYPIYDVLYLGCTTRFFVDSKGCERWKIGYVKDSSRQEPRVFHEDNVNDLRDIPFGSLHHVFIMLNNEQSAQNMDTGYSPKNGVIVRATDIS